MLDYNGDTCLAPATNKFPFQIERSKKKQNINSKSLNDSQALVKSKVNLAEMRQETDMKNRVDVVHTSAVKVDASRLVQWYVQ